MGNSMTNEKRARLIARNICDVLATCGSLVDSLAVKPLFMVLTIWTIRVFVKSIATIDQVSNARKVWREVGKVIETMETALLIVDVQNDFAHPEGALYVNDGFKIVPIINQLRNKTEFDLVVLTQDYHPREHVSFLSSHSHNPDAKLFKPLDLGNGKIQMMWPDHCVQGTQGANYHSDLVLYASDKIIQKGTDKNADSYSAFMDNDEAKATELETLLRLHTISRVVLVGLAFDYCVGFTALDAKKAGFEVVVCKDATKSVASDSEKEMEVRLSEAGIQCESTMEYLANVASESRD